MIPGLPRFSSRSLALRNTYRAGRPGNEATPSMIIYVLTILCPDLGEMSEHKASYMYSTQLIMMRHWSILYTDTPDWQQTMFVGCHYQYLLAVQPHHYCAGSNNQNFSKQKDQGWTKNIHVYIVYHDINLMIFLM